MASQQQQPFEDPLLGEEVVVPQEVGEELGNQRPIDDVSVSTPARKSNKAMLTLAIFVGLALAALAAFGGLKASGLIFPPKGTDKVDGGQAPQQVGGPQEKEPQPFYQDEVDNRGK
ncbi:hypothetical protein ACSSS7_008015 [Eimeria intestinalis]